MYKVSSVIDRTLVWFQKTSSDGNGQIYGNFLLKNPTATFFCSGIPHPQMPVFVNRFKNSTATKTRTHA